MSKKNKHDGSELHDKGKKKRNEQISNRREGPYKESVIQKQSIKSFKLDYEIWTGDPVEISVAERN